MHAGPSHMYSSGHFDPAAANFVDYTPGYLYVLLLLGKVSHAVTGGPPSVFAVKLPGIAADLGVALLVMALAVRVTPPNAERRFPVRAAAAAAVLFNPALILVSAVWGQVDSVLALLVLGGIYVLVSGEPGLPATRRPLPCSRSRLRRSRRPCSSSPFSRSCSCADT